jgi:predicted DNA-binding protein
MTKTLLRISSESYEKIRELSKKEHRSINQMLVHIIERYLNER